MYQKQVTFKEAVESALMQNYCNFSGRASRSQFWWWVLFTAIVSFVVGIVFCFNQDLQQIASAIVSLAFLLPGLGVAVRRLHDINKSGWFILLGLIPIIGAIILLVWYTKESDPTPNEYGPVPNLVG